MLGGYAQYSDGTSASSTTSSPLSPNMEDAKSIFKSNFWYGIMTILLYLIIGVVAYSFIFEGWHWIDSLYFSMVTFTTVSFTRVDCFY